MDGNGNLGAALNANNYYVTETNYGWDAEPGDDLGDLTNTSDWPLWFNDTKMPYVYANNAHYAYGNAIPDPGGENQIIMFKSCFPCSEVGSSIDDEKAIYNSLLPYFAAHQDKLFVLITPPGETVVSSWQLTRELCDWLVDTSSGWLAGYPGKNVFVFDFYCVLSEINSHHRWNLDHVEHVYAADYDGISPYHDGDNHPNPAGNQKATLEYLPLLNIAYNRWKAVSGPSIDYLEPSYGDVGDNVIIHGNNFGSSQGSSHVTFGEQQATNYVSWSNQQIVCQVPAGISGAVPVMVTTDEGTSNHDCFIQDSTPQTSFYFAEGCTREGFHEYLTLLNSNSSAVSATVTFMFGDRPPQAMPMNLGARTRTTVDVNAVAGSGRDVSILVAAGAPIVAERPLYFNYGTGWDGGHDVVGAPLPQTSFYFAEGCTMPGFEEWLCLQNPNAAPTTAHVTFMYTDGSSSAPLDVPLEGTSRTTLNVNQEAGAGKDVSIKVTADAPIVAERPMYFNYKGWTGGHDVMGAPLPQTSFYFAEGYTGYGFQEYLCLFNPQVQQAHLYLTYIYSSGNILQQEITLEATSRKTIHVNSSAGSGRFVSIRVLSNRPIVAERPMYFNYGGWTGGHDVVGYTP